MKKKIFALLALVMTVMTASAIDAPTFALTKADDAEAHGTIAFSDADGNALKAAAEGTKVTVTVTPDDGWTVKEVTGIWYAGMAAVRTRVDMLDREFEPASAGENTWTFTMERAIAEISVTYKKLLSNPDITIDGLDETFTYTGLAQTPAITVKDGETTLVLGTDYTVSYTNNVNAALSTAAESAPTVTITAVATSENYAGEASKTFTIGKAELTVTADDKSVDYGEDAPEYTVSYDGFVNSETESVLGGTLAFDCSYKKGSDTGTYDIMPSGLTSDNYTITFAKGTLTVGKAVLSGIEIYPTMLQYNGQEQSVAIVSVTAGNVVVDPSFYTVSGGTATDAGSYYVVVTINDGVKNFSGSISAGFSIVPGHISENGITITGDPENPTVTVSYGDVTLVEGKDYTVTVNKSESGDVSVTVTGKGNYVNTITKTFTNEPVIPYVAEFDVPASDGNDDGVDNVKMTVEVSDDSAITREERTFVDPSTGEEVTKEVNVVPVEITGITIPEQEEQVNPETGETEKAEITVEVPAEFVSNDGSTVYEVTSIGPNAITSNTNTAVVSTVELPDTEEPINIKSGALDVDNLPVGDPSHRMVNVNVPLKLLDDYALMPVLRDQVSNGMVRSTVVLTSQYTTFSSGADVELSDDIKVFAAKIKDAEEVEIKEITGDELTLANGVRGVKANNGVIISFDSSTQGARAKGGVVNTFASNANVRTIEFVASSTNLSRIGTKPTTENAKSYSGNELIPVIEKKSFEPSVLILEDDEFHPIGTDGKKEVPACSAVLMNPSGSLTGKLTITVSDPTGIRAVELLYGEGDDKWYDLNGNRIERPTKKGVYIINGHKVMVK